jgi:hypothetical protein
MQTPGGPGAGPNVVHQAAIADLGLPGREQRPVLGPPLTSLQAPSPAGCGGLPFKRGRIIGGSALCARHGNLVIRWTAPPRGLRGAAP